MPHANDSQLAVCRVGHPYVDPTMVGSMHVLFNLAHADAAVLKVHNVRYPYVVAAAAACGNSSNGNDDAKGDQKCSAAHRSCSRVRRTCVASAGSSAGSQQTGSFNPGSTCGSVSGASLALGPCEQVFEVQQRRHGGAELAAAGPKVELTWDYAATTTDPDDPMLGCCACVGTVTSWWAWQTAAKRCWSKGQHICRQCTNCGCR